MLSRPGIEQNPRGVDAGRCYHHHPRAHRPLRLAVTVEILHSVRAALAIGHDSRYHRVIDHLEAARAQRWLDQVVRCIEESTDVATLATGAAVVAGGASVVRPGEHCTASRHDAD